MIERNRNLALGGLLIAPLLLLSPKAVSDEKVVQQKMTSLMPSDAAPRRDTGNVYDYFILPEDEGTNGEDPADSSHEEEIQDMPDNAITTVI